jgi:hypothetical protein
MAREERADSILGGTDEFIANIDIVLAERDQRSASPAHGRLIGRLEEAVKQDKDEHALRGWRGRLDRIEHLRGFPSRR